MCKIFTEVWVAFFWRIIQGTKNQVPEDQSVGFGFRYNFCTGNELVVG